MIIAGLLIPPGPSPKLQVMIPPGAIRAGGVSISWWHYQEQKGSEVGEDRRANEERRQGEPDHLELFYDKRRGERREGERRTMRSPALNQGTSAHRIWKGNF